MTQTWYDPPRFRLAGDRGLLAEFGEGIALAINRRVRAVAIGLEERMPAGILEVMPTYRSVLVVYDPMRTAPEQLKKEILEIADNLDENRIPPPKTIEIPVCYGGEFGPDIAFVADAHDLSEKEVVEIHSEPEYPVYMIGFTPGFPFLGGLSEALHTPRLETPRTRVPEGSVGIANAQTGVYPVASPGGWRIIGRTPLRLFAPEKEHPFRYSTGDRIRFVPISAEDYRRIEAEEKRAAK